MTQTAGYSGTPLTRKLGFKPGFRVLPVNAPDNYRDLLNGVEGVTFLGPDEPAPDAIHLFLHARADFARIPTLLARLGPKGMLWLSWAKKSSALHAGITEDDLRDEVLPTGWVDVKVCAVDADWSGLKFLRRRNG